MLFYLHILLELRNLFNGFIFEEYLPYFKLVSFLASSILFVIILYLIIKTNLIGYKIDSWVGTISIDKLHRRRTIRGWQEIQRRMKTGDEAQIKLAIIDADKILDETIKMIGYRGDTMADRLKQLSPAQLSNINSIWEVHKVRNRIVHDMDFSLTEHEAKIAISIYKQAFSELGLID